MSYKNNCKLSGAILAGGKSSRMGEKKALLQLEQKQLIKHTIEIVEQYIKTPILITNSQDEFQHLNLPMFGDIVENAGPLGGIYTALKHCHTTHCLIVACDLPFITDELVRFICENAPAYDLFAIDVGNGVEPLFAVYSASCIPAIENQIDEGNYRVTDFFSEVDTKVCYFEESNRLYSPELLFNVNTQEDLNKARRIFRKRQYTGFC